ncbi:MAG: DNA gyrase inhibitor YacG [Candidatus Dasytiphilus stammeri]
MYQIKCPICFQKLIWNKANKFRPFCSYRCKLIDLGEWITEEKHIYLYNEKK